MENNQAILNCIDKTIQFKFEDQDFQINLTEGDLEDSWNSIESRNRVLDSNFYWEENDKPYFSLYELKLGADGTWSTDTTKPYSFELIQMIGTYEIYSN